MNINWILDTVSGFSSTSLVIALVTLLAGVAYYSLKTSGLPPGPTGVPFLGYWPFLNQRKCHLQLDGMKNKYGDIFSLNVTGSLYINLGSAKTIREAHISKSDCFAKRPEVFNLLTLIFSGGVAFLESEEWKVIRKFFLQSMKERLSLSVKDLLSGSMYDSVKSIVDELRAKKGETVNIVEFLTGKCNAIMRLTLFGESGISEDRVKEIKEYYGFLMSCFTPGNTLLNGNIARYLIFPLMPGYKETVVNLRKVETILYKIIDEHKSTYDEEHIRDIIDEYIRERSTRRSKGDPTAHYFTDTALMSSLIQIIGESVLSVAAFISLFIKAALDHPEEQEKIYQELVEVVGLDRNPTVEDKSKLTYTNAFILEAQRKSDFFPLFPSMECTKETTLCGYRIPKGAITLMNMYSANNDPKVYKEPHKFDSTRYIVTDGKQKPEPLTTFGMGKRACIGESFTMMQVFLFVTTLIKNFRILQPDGVNDSSDELLTEGRLRISAQPRN